MTRRNRLVVIAAIAFHAFAGIAFFPRGAQAGTKLKIGWLPLPGHAKFMIAQEEGFFAKEGLDTELVGFINSAEGINALKAGDIDIGAFGTSAPLVNISKGVDLRIIGGIMGEDASLLTTAKNAATIKSIPDLKGKKIATVRLATGDAVLRGALKAAGLDWRTDVQITEVRSPPEVLEAVKTGKVDAGMVWGPFDLQGEEQGLKVVIRSASLYPGHPCCRLVVRGERMTEAGTWEKVLRALLRAEKFARENHEKTLDDIVKYVKLDRAVVQKGFYHSHLEQRTDPNLHGVQRFWATMQESGFIEAKGSIDSKVELAPYKAALDSLAKESPKDPFWQLLDSEFARRNL